MLVIKYQSSRVKENCHQMQICRQKHNRHLYYHYTTTRPITRPITITTKATTTTNVITKGTVNCGSKARTVIYCMLLWKNNRLLVESGLRFVRRFSSKRPAVLNTRSLAEEDAGTHRIRHATLNSCGSKARLSFQNFIISTSFAIFMFCLLYTSPSPRD